MNEGKPAGNKTRDWIIRSVVFGALGVVLVLAVLDYQAKTQAQDTSDAWDKLLNEANAENASDVPLEKLKDGMKGSPEVTESQGQNVYTWKGPFRKYVVTVTYDPQTPSKSVDSIEGIGKSAEE
jgi:hypothetical protein